MCGKAVMLGRLLGVEAAKADGDIVEHIETPLDEICKHCQYGLPGRNGPGEIAAEYAAGKHPDITPTFDEAFERQGDSELVQLETV